MYKSLACQVRRRSEIALSLNLSWTPALKNPTLHLIPVFHTVFDRYHAILSSFFPPWAFGHWAACRSHHRWLNAVELCMPPSLSRSIMGQAWAVHNLFRLATAKIDPRGGKWVHSGGCSQTSQILARTEPLSIDGRYRSADLPVTDVHLWACRNVCAR